MLIELELVDTSHIILETDFIVSIHIGHSLHQCIVQTVRDTWVIASPYADLVKRLKSCNLQVSPLPKQLSLINEKP
jgi:hypothetical protein